MSLRLLCAAAVFSGVALADDLEGFSGGPNGTMVHGPSGFVCPPKLGLFERDAVGLRDPVRNADYCAYSAAGGVYGTIVIAPLPSTFDPKAALADQFALQQAMGATVVGDTVQTAGTPGLPVYLRTYETARLESLHYRTLFANAAVGAWSVQVILEFAYPHDKDAENAFLNSVYTDALREMGGAH